VHFRLDTLVSMWGYGQHNSTILLCKILKITNFAEPNRYCCHIETHWCSVAAFAFPWYQDTVSCEDCILQPLKEVHVLFDSDISLCTVLKIRVVTVIWKTNCCLSIVKVCHITVFILIQISVKYVLLVKEMYMQSFEVSAFINAVWFRII